MFVKEKIKEEISEREYQQHEDLYHSDVCTQRLIFVPPYFRLSVSETEYERVIVCSGLISHSITSCRVTSMFQMTMPPSELQEIS